MKESIPLKEIVGFLPYGLNVKTNNLIRKMVIKTSDLVYVHQITRDKQVSISNVINEIGHKPIVRPLSDLTKEITHNGETFVPIQELRKISGAIEPSEDLKNTFSVKMDEERIIGFTALCMHIDQLLLFQKLYEWHFDIYDWIKDGLAIDINTLNQ